MESDPAHPHSHGYAYLPAVSTSTSASVSSWLQQQHHHHHPDSPHDDDHDDDAAATAAAAAAAAAAAVPDSPPPDDYYRSAYATTDHHVGSLSLPRQRIDMAAATRPRQATTNGARSPPKPAPRAASGPSPHAANKVKALAERFERSPGGSPAAASPARSRSREPSRTHAHEASKRPHASQPATASAARPSKEAAYGAYKFNNLKPRERPQPAPAAPRSARRTNGSRSSIDQQQQQQQQQHHDSPTRKKVAPTRRPPSSARQPFFGEVVGQDVTAPGFGIQNSLEPLADGPRLSATSFTPSRHQRSASGATLTHDDGQPAQPSERATLRSPPQRATPSRIPVAARRLSAGSDSNSSTRSVKYTPTRANDHSNRSSPTRMHRKPVASDQSTLPALAYRGYRERGKSPLGARSGPSVPAVVAAPPAPTSPRLRNSRERQQLQPSPNSRSRSSDPHDEQSYFPGRHSLDSLQDLSLNDERVAVGGIPKFDRSPDPHAPHQQADHLLHEENYYPSPPQHQRLSLQTSSLSVPPSHQPMSATTDFEESPILGLPGSFVLTPPTAYQEPEQPLLQPTVFSPPGKAQQIPSSPDFEQSELGVRESIPIMLGEEEPTSMWEPSFADIDEGLQALSFDYRPEQQHHASEKQPASRYDLDDSPIDPFPNRDTLRPDDSASIAPYQKLGSLAFNSETYSVVNSVLNMYHQSPAISQEMATASRERVQRVSPVIAQHDDWGSKEATETYLARLLSDANGSAVQAAMDHPNNSTAQSRPSLHVPQADHEYHEAEVGGTAIIYPSESRRYSRGSAGSAATTIHDDASRSGSSFGNPSQDSLLQDSTTATNHTSAATNGIELPQLAWTNGGLGLSLHSGLSHSSQAQPAPPRPAYSPPPPPAKVSIDQQFASPDDSSTLNSHTQPTRSSLIDEQFAMHPARSHDPIIKTREQSLEDRYGTPQPVENAIQTTAGAEKGESDQPDPAKQALIKRYRILEELLTTEHQFCIDMMIAHNIFEATAGNLMSEKEKKILFSNCKELEKFSLSLFRAFKKAAKPIVNYEIPPPTGPWNRDPSDARPSNPPEASLTLRRPSEDSQNQFETCTVENDHLTTIGQVFLENREKMERLYTTYFLNQDNASAYMKKNQGNPELASWVVACFEQVENMTQAWDLDSLLLKPCQRLLKYPLLLEGLMNCSTPDHPDLQNLKDAKAELLAINVRINEAKARSDTFRAAASEGKKEKSRGKGIGKTFVKAFIPKVDKNKAYDEADRAFKDQDYKSREQKFGGHFFQLQIVIRDFEQYLDSITEHYMQLNVVFLGFITVCEVAPSVYPEVESTWRKWAMAHFELQNKALEDHKAAVRSRVLKPVGDLWEMWVSYQKTIEQRKKFLLYYVKYKQAIDRGEKVDPDLEESAKKFTTINDTLKHELPLLYERTKSLMRTLMTLFMCLQKDWYKTCSKKILPLLESEPQHTTSLRYDLESYVERFHSDYKPMQDLANRLGIVNRNLLVDISNMTSPVPTISSDGGSSRNSSSRRTESMGSEASILDSRNRNSGGYGPRPHQRTLDNPPRSSPAGPAYPSLFPGGPTGRAGPGPTSLREARALSPVSDNSESTIVHERRNTGPSRNHNYLGLDGAVEYDDRSPLGSGSFDFPPQLGASFLSPTAPPPLIHSVSAPASQPTSLPNSSRASAIFTSALPMSDSPIRGSHEELPTTPADTDEPEVLFLAASLFEFNIAHDRREGGIPYLVYVPGEIFDVIGMKGELWLARNQDDSTKTVGWIWEKHFARILPEDA